MHALILAGGKGTRLWPLSRTTTPKQLLSPLNETESLLIQSAKRIEVQGIKAENIHLVTTQEQMPLFKNSWKGFGNIIQESAAKNTGPAVLLGAKYLESLGIDKFQPIGIFPSDHYISDFNLDTQLDCKDKMYCFTITPTRAETGYGYIQLEAGNKLRKVESFKEKPDLPTAQQWFEAWSKDPKNPTNKFWNSGLYIFSLNSLGKALETSSPQLFQFWSEKCFEVLNKQYHEFPKISFDVLIAEKASNLFALPLPCSKWRDIGSWESVHEALSVHAYDNTASSQAEMVATQAKGNLAFSTQKKLIAFAGVENLAVIDTGDALLIADKHNAAAMQELLALLEKDYPDYC